MVGSRHARGPRWAWASPRRHREGPQVQAEAGSAQGSRAQARKVVWEPALGEGGREGGRAKTERRPPESRRGGPGRGCSGRRQIAVIRDFKRLGEGLGTEALLPVRTGSPNPGPHLGLPGTSLISPLSPQVSLGPCLPLSGSPSLPVRPCPPLRLCSEPPRPCPGPSSLTSQDCEDHKVRKHGRLLHLLHLPTPSPPPASPAAVSPSTAPSAHVPIACLASITLICLVLPSLSGVSLHLPPSSLLYHSARV